MDYILRPLWTLLISLKNLFFPITFAIETTSNLNSSNPISLDSSSATKKANDSEKAPTCFIMPDLIGHCPFPLGRHPEADELTAASTQWLVDGCPELDPKEFWGLQVRNSMTYSHNVNRAHRNFRLDC